LLPYIVTEVPTGPEEGLKKTMEGACPMEFSPIKTKGNNITKRDSNPFIISGWCVGLRQI
jgi:hypothetical protein